jgi:hypothetical protein
MNYSTRNCSLASKPIEARQQSSTWLQEASTGRSSTSPRTSLSAAARTSFISVIAASPSPGTRDNEACRRP